MELVFGTRIREREWRIRHLRKGNDWGSNQHHGKPDEWVLCYWDSRDHPHRQFLVEKVAAFSPHSSVLEIGCNCGPNLYLLAKRFPGADIRGIDINPMAVDKGNELLVHAGITNVKLSLGKADDLRQFENKSFDVVFTDAVLIYIGRDRIEKVMQEMIRVSRYGLVLLERHRDSHNMDKLGLGVRFGGCWERDYVALLSQFMPADHVRVSRLSADLWTDDRWKTVGAIVEVRL